MAAVYQHIKIKNREVFYVGITSVDNSKRPFEKTDRSVFWKSVASLNPYYVDIVCSDISFENAKQIEKDLIKHYGRRDENRGPLVNMTDGGDGHVNPSPEERKARSERAKNRQMSEKTRVKMRAANLGDKNYFYGIQRFGKENLNYGKICPTHVREASIKANTGKVVSQKTKELQSSQRSRGKHNQAKKVKNIETGEIFMCIKDACDALELNYKNTVKYLNGTRKNNPTQLVYFTAEKSYKS